MFLSLFALTVQLAVGTPAAKVSPTVVDSRTIIGHIETIDGPHKSVVVTEAVKPPRSKTPPPKPQSVAVSVTGETLLVRGKSPATFESLKPKEHVVVRYRMTATGALALSFRVADVARPTPTTAPVASTSSSAPVEPGGAPGE
jgi:hypothetical protein